jgi:hypothetical protein
LLVVALIHQSSHLLGLLSANDLFPALQSNIERAALWCAPDFSQCKFNASHAMQVPQCYVGR